MSSRAARAAAVLCAAQFVSACSLFNTHVVASRRYARLDSTGVPKQPANECVDGKVPFCLDARLSATVIPADPPLAVTALSDRGQGAYVAGLADVATSADALTAAVAVPLKSAAAAPGSFQDNTAVKLRFELALLPRAGFLAPGDRVAWAQVRMQPMSSDGTPARFTGWNQATNAHDTIDVGTVSTQRTESLGLSGGVALAPGVTGPSLTGQIGSTRGENQTLTDRTSLYAAVDNGDAWIVQYGAWQRDLIGTTTFDATVLIAPDHTQTLDLTTTSEEKVKAAKPGQPAGWLPASRMMLGQRSSQVPKPQMLCANLTLDFIVRHVTSGAKTISEADDGVQLMRGHSVHAGAVLPLVTTTWRVGLLGRPLQFAGDDRTNFVLRFADRTAAADFVDWLRAAAVTGRVGNGRLYFDDVGKGLGAAERANLAPFNANPEAAWEAASAGCQSDRPAATAPASAHPASGTP